MGNANDRQAAEIDQAYLGTQFEFVAHRQTKIALEDAFEGRARRGEPPPTITVTVDPLELRHERLAQQIIRLLEAAGRLTLSEWSDLIEFHEVGESNASSRLGLLDWLCKSAPSEVRDLILASGFLRLPYTPPGHHEQEARIAGTLRRFFRQCSPQVQRRGTTFFELLDQQHSGITLWMDGNGCRFIEPYVGTRESTRAS